MSPLFDKLNLKNQAEIVVINAPQSFEAELERLDGVSVVRTPGKATDVEFAVAFVTTQAELDKLSRLLATKAKGDAILWFAYPKKTSRRYTCEFNRDSGWDAIRQAGFDSVRMVAIDEDWSALRFRRSEHIKSATARR
jgi:hypothetical protein